jgi:hypothetical protein
MRLAARLDERDRAILATLADFRLAQGDQLRRLHLAGVDPRSGRRTLARLQHLGLISRLERRIGGKRGGSDGSLFHLTSNGVRLVRPDRPARSPWPVSPQFQDHTLAVTELYAGLAEVHRARLATLSSFIPEAERRFTGLFGQPVVIRADAFIRLDGPDYFDLFFIEVDLGTESPATIRRKAASYFAYYVTGREQATSGGVFPKVVFLAATPEQAGRLTAALMTSPPAARRLTSVGVLNEAVRLLLAGGPDPLGAAA